MSGRRIEEKLRRSITRLVCCSTAGKIKEGI